jgi:uncharacterized protein YqeY
MLADEIKTRMFAAMKAKNTVEKEILRVALGEIQTAGARSDKALGEDAVGAILKKLVKSNQESFDVSSDEEQKRVLAEEIEILNSLLPQTLSVEQIVEALSSVTDGIKGAKADGPATGNAMKHLKQSGALVDGKNVALAVKQIRT